MVLEFSYRNTGEPWAVVEARQPGKKWKTIGLIIDTGATYTLFNKDLGELMNFDAPGLRETVQSAGSSGGDVKYVWRKVVIKFPDGYCRCVDVAWAFHSKHPRANALGRDVLSKFKQTFDPKNNKVILARYSDKPPRIQAKHKKRWKKKEKRKNP